MIINKGFTQKREVNDESRKRLPPGQYLTHDFPVLSLGPTPEIDLKDWNFKMHLPTFNFKGQRFYINRNHMTF